MPRKLTPDAEVAKGIRAAITRIEDGKPRNEKLRKRARRGTLKLSPTTVAIETDIDRHLIGGQDCLYSAERELILTLMAKKGTVVPLRRQLDEARKEKKEALERLERSRTVNAHLLTRMHKQDLEVRRLEEELAAAEEDEEPLIGSGRISVLPARQKRDTSRKPQKGADQS